jgi:2-methylcitrate dehydratase PrpD
MLSPGHGVLRTFALDSIDVAPVTAGLGEAWEASRLAIKLFPACQAVQPVVDCAIDIYRRYAPQADRVKGIRIWIPPIGVKLCEPFEERTNPPNGLAGKYSLPFTVAYGLRHGQLTEAAFDWPVDDELVALARQVSWTIDPAYDSDEAPGRVEVTTTDGATLTAEVAACRGTWQYPLAKVDVQAKFTANVKATLAESPDRVIALVEDIANLHGVRELFDACVLRTVSDGELPEAVAVGSPTP